MQVQIEVDEIIRIQNNRIFSKRDLFSFVWAPLAISAASAEVCSWYNFDTGD